MGNMRAVRLGIAMALVVGLLAVLPAATSMAAGDPREVKGRALFAKGEYQGALEIFAALFAEKGDPIYLRNVGRCYQKLQEPGKAIDSFKEYLRRSPRLKASEREEIRGFIREMEELKAEQRKSEPVAPPVEPIKPPPAEHAHDRPPRVVKDDGSGGSQPPVISKPGEPGGGAAPESESVFKKWWFWTAVGAVLVGGTVATIVILNSRGTAFPQCTDGFTCPR
jgi:tetratricopeptide (TPR) repeat protein